MMLEELPRAKKVDKIIEATILEMKHLGCNGILQFSRLGRLDSKTICLCDNIMGIKAHTCRVHTYTHPLCSWGPIVHCSCQWLVGGVCMGGPIVHCSCQWLVGGSMYGGTHCTL